MSASEGRPPSSLFSRSVVSSVTILLLGAGVVLLCLGAAAFAYIRAPSVAYIDSGMLMERYDEAVAARKEISAEQAKWTENIQTLRSELETLNQKLVEEGAAWSKTRREAEQDTLKEKRRELMRYRRAVQEKTKKLRRETMKPVYSQMNADIESFGKAKGYDIILGTLQGGNILFAEDATNVTERFLAYANPEGAVSEAVAKQAATGTRDGLTENTSNGSN